MNLNFEVDFGTIVHDVDVDFAILASKFWKNTKLLSLWIFSLTVGKRLVNLLPSRYPFLHVIGDVLNLDQIIEMKCWVKTNFDTILGEMWAKKWFWERFWSCFDFENENFLYKMFLRPGAGISISSLWSTACRLPSYLKRNFLNSESRKIWILSKMLLQIMKFDAILMVLPQNFSWGIFLQQMKSWSPL